MLIKEKLMKNSNNTLYKLKVMMMKMSLTFGQSHKLKTKKLKEEIIDLLIDGLIYILLDIKEIYIKLNITRLLYFIKRKMYQKLLLGAVRILGVYLILAILNEELHKFLDLEILATNLTQRLTLMVLRKCINSHIP